MDASGHATKKKIFEVLYELTKETPYEDIKISDICAKADVARSTFYHHFNNKFDIVCWHYDLVLSLGVNRVGISLGWLDAHLITTMATKKYYDFYSKVKQPNSSSQFFPSYYSMNREKALKHALVDVKKIELTPKLEFQIRGLSHAEEWAIRDWYRGNINVGLHEICEYMVSLVPDDLYQALKEPEFPEEFPIVDALVGSLLD